METSKQATDEHIITEEDRAKRARRLKWKWTEALIWTDSMLAAIPKKFFADNGLINMEELQRQYLACQSR
jgi:hypothetical protein